MATEAVTASEHEHLADAAVSAGVPYGPSWVDRLLSWIEGLPGPTWLAYLALGAALTAFSIAQVMLGGETDALTIAENGFWGLVIAVTLWLVHHLAGVAGEAFDAFRPLLTVTDTEAARLRYELRVTPPGPALAILVFSAVSSPLYWWLDPASSAVAGLSPVQLALRFISEAFFGGLLLAFAYQSIRQLRAVARIHSEATQVDLFRPAPLYAFSVLTSRTAIVLALIFAITSAVGAVQGGDQGSGTVFIGYALIGVVLGAFVFVVPLLGMRRRISAEKARLQGEVGKRIETTIDAVHAAVDGGDLSSAASMNDALGVLIAERDLVEKLPTFPWRPGTLGAVLTAIALPLGLWVATRLLERVI